MTFGKQIELGFRTYTKAIGFIFSNGLWWTFIFPLLFNLLLFFGGYAVVGSVTDWAKEWVMGWVIPEMGISLSLDFLPDVISIVIGVLIKVLFFFIFAYVGGYITLILLSPVLAWVSERTDEIISGKKYPFVFSQFMGDVLRGIFIALRNLLLETGWMILLFLLGFIPVVGWLGAIPLFLISAYFYGFSFMDYTCERRRMNISQSVEFIRRHKWLAVANGSLFCLFLLIPFCGILLAGFLAIVSSVAATLAIAEAEVVQKR